jgi:hypothetical protein
MKRTILFIMAALAIVTPSSGQAQFVSTPAPNNGGSIFWDNLSWDGERCNIGYVVTGQADGSCGSQRPNGWLPFTDPNYSNPPLAKSIAGNALFTTTGPATVTAFGDIAGQNRDWGWFSGTTFTSLNSLVPLTTTFTPDGPWGFWTDLTDGTRALSTGNQFAFFKYNQAGKYLVGIEDIELRHSDRDYNDVLFAVRETSVVPEPSTYVLMAAGLFGVWVMSRRRKMG